MELQLITSIVESNNAGTFEDDAFIDLEFTKNPTEINLIIKKRSDAKSYLAIDLNKEKALHLLNFLKASLPYMTDF
jgi:hypothetical protein